MDKGGLLASIYEGATYIDQGRRGLDTKGKTEKGRVNFRKGLSRAMEAFKEVQQNAEKDLELALIAEYTFISQELNFCTPTDEKARSRLNQAIMDFDRAFPVLETIQKPAQYKIFEKCLGLRSAFWHYKLPKDAFHVACLGHIARLNNILSSPGINLLEKELLEQRLVNIRTAQSIYSEKQKKALGIKIKSPTSP